jgi:DTW domain-containing protein
VKSVKGKRKTQDPCERCFLHKERCICAFIPSLNLPTRLSLVIHKKELRRTTNTGVLATHALQNSQIFVRGDSTEPLDLNSLLDPSYRPMLLFPADGAVLLTPELIAESPLPVHLIVPDGNWRQASKVNIRHPEISNISRVTLKADLQDQYRIRAEHIPNGMATLQAIAHALGIIEGSSVKQELLELYRIKLEMTMLGRGVRFDADS